MEENIDWDLLAKHLNDECNESEKLRFEQWLNASDKNRVEFESVKKNWVAFKKFDYPNHSNPEKVWNKIQSNLEKPKPTKVKKLNPQSLVYKVAAIIIVLLGTSYLGFQLLKNGSESRLAVVSHYNNTQQAKEVQLADGTVVWLAQHSGIEYDELFGKQDERHIRLTGEAFFDVERMVDKPFVITTRKSKVTVLGTSFNVNARKEKKIVTVNVATGKVALSGHTTSESLILESGQQGILHVSSGKVKKINNDDPNIWSYQSGVIVFDQSNLEYIMAVLRKHYGVSTISKLSADQSQAIELTATFKEQPLEKVVETLKFTLGVSVHNQEGTVIFGE